MEKRMERIGEICFWIGIVVELLIVIVDKSAYINPFEGVLFRLTFLLFCAKTAMTKYSRDEWLMMVLVGVIAAVSYFINERDEAVRAVAFVAACKGMDLKRMLKATLAVTAAGTVILLVLSLTGIYGALSVTADFGRGMYVPDGMMETRYCFGMGHPNAFQTMLLMMSTLCVYIYVEEMKLYHFVLLAAMNIAAYFFTDSNTGMLVMLAVVAGVILLKYCRPLREGKAVYIASGILVMALAAFSAYGSHVGRDTPVMYEIDQILNGRFQYSNIYEMARIENWKLFAAPENIEYFDQGFIRLFYWYGIIPGCTFMAAVFYLIWQSCKNKDYALLVIVVANMVYMIMESHIISVYLLRNYLFIWLGFYWYQPFARQNRFEGYFWQLKGLSAW